MSEEAVDLRAAVEEGMQEDKPEDHGVEVTWSEDEAAEAEAMGWIPPERSGKLPEGKKFVGPKEYMERNPLYGKLKNLESAIGQMTAHQQKVIAKERKKAEQEFEQRLANLKEEKIQAMEDQDHKRVVEIDEEIRTTEKPEAEPDDGEKVIKDWVANGNEWYENDSFLKVEADLIGSQLYSEKLYGIKLLDEVKKHLKQKYPEKFENPNRKKPPAVEGGTNGGGKKSKSFTASDLTRDEAEIFKNFDRLGTFKSDDERAQYIKDVIELRD